MFQSIVIGNVGADAQYQSKDGREFTTFRIAHNDSWTDQNGQRHDNTTWVDCIMNGHPKVAEFIKQGTQVVVVGNVTLRCYASPKDKCMKAGATVNVVTVQLLGGAVDDVPKRLFDERGQLHEVRKAYYSDVKGCTLLSQRGDIYNVDANGWIVRLQAQPQEQPQNATVDQSQMNADGSPSEIY